MTRVICYLVTSGVEKFIMSDEIFVYFLIKNSSENYLKKINLVFPKSLIQADEILKIVVYMFFVSEYNKIIFLCLIFSV